MARFSLYIFPNSGGTIVECLPWILCCFGCNEERVSWRQKSVFCLIIAIFNHRKICSSWLIYIITFFPPQICHLYWLWCFWTQMWTWRAWWKKQCDAWNWAELSSPSSIHSSSLLQSLGSPELAWVPRMLAVGMKDAQLHLRSFFPFVADGSGPSTHPGSIQCVPCYPLCLREKHLKKNFFLN